MIAIGLLVFLACALAFALGCWCLLQCVARVITHGLGRD